VDVLQWARAVFALIATLALIGLAAYGARRLNMLQGAVKGPRRLKITESLTIDPRRRLVVVRFDDREHVLLLSPTRDLLVADAPAKDEPKGET
jgi:flagellar protein FliO/FliZ